jgi:hypothetical protein
MNLTLTFFRNYAASRKDQKTLELEEVVRLLAATSAKTKDNLPWLKLARFGTTKTDKGSLRHDENVIDITGIEADYDGGAVSFDKAVEIAEKAGLLAILYTSPSHRPDKPRWRILCSISTDLPPHDRAHLLDRLNGLYGGVFAAESWSISQSYFFGSVDHNPNHRVEIVDGEYIDELDDLDFIAIGKPATNTTGSNGAKPGRAVGADEAALLEQIITGESYHTAAIRLLGLWARQKVPMLEAEQRLRAAFEGVFSPDRDERWHARIKEIPRLLEHVWGKETQKTGSAAESQ